MSHLQSVTIPDFGAPLIRPEIPAETLVDRCDRLYEKAGLTWVFVYADREHNANILFLTGFDPRFEEAVLLLGPQGRRIVITGNESESFTAISPLPGLEVMLSQSMSLMAQDRSKKPNLEAVLRDAGIKAGDTLGIVGWKYLEAAEWDEVAPGYLVPHYMVVVLARILGGAEGLSDETALLMHPAHGLRSVVDADQIAAFEWASTRASASVWSVLSKARPGQREIEAAANFLYAGEPLSAHSMFASGDATHAIHGLNSAGARVLAKGDGVTTAVGYWGGLSSRAGLLDDADDVFVGITASYFDSLVTWYETAKIGTTGGELHEAVVEKLAASGLKSALNPGHLVSYDEWSHSPVRPGSIETLVSGMVFQVDVIPTPMAAGKALNCEDAVAIADVALRAELAVRHPQTWSRIEARRAFLRDTIGVALGDHLLPLSNIQLCLPPLWLKSDHLIVRS
ncbi:Xaa-Pro aminopeptidase [Devosia sp. LC5]|uniref:M24 family metallopeptidase n=1 Tax=Devosia sp. LC5 TaxID=1502724 RepID=UPI0004E32B48|nr:M24 family metallopeptidase [Devosia sp. LC5]KFC68197.1 Xaa-Pro aminopeptidase [Devosia sp. LC5]